MYLYYTPTLKTFLINYPEGMISTLSSNNVGMDSKIEVSSEEVETADM